MQGKKGKREWVKVLNSEMWHLKEVREEVLGPLALSYYDLTPELRQCFQFCAVFPKDYEMDKDQLIKLWISQGFVRATRPQEVEEDIGEEYFQVLATRSFFQDFRHSAELGAAERTHFKMHDLVHDFAEMLSKNECLRMTRKDMEDVTTASSSSRGRGVVRNLRIDYYFFRRSSMHQYYVFSSLKNLRSFMAERVETIEPDVWGYLRGIRSLVLTSGHQLHEIPSAISQLIHLRHLDLSGNTMLTELPDEICELYNLWALILDGNYRMKRLPLGMGDKLVNLKHLGNDSVGAPLPKSIGRLTCLKTLTNLTIRKHQPEGEEATIADLKDMNHLQGTLSVFGLSNVTDSYEVEKADFVKKTSLACLWLVFGSDDSDTDSDNDDNNNEDDDYDGEASGDKDIELLEAVRPSTNLEKLVIGMYKGASISPSWMTTSLLNLTRIQLVRCKRATCLPPLGGLPSLEKVVFVRMDRVKKVGVEFLGHDVHVTMMNDDVGAFPRLTLLQFEHMREWEDWDDDDTMLSSQYVMPRLHTLNVDKCTKIKMLPDAILQKPTLRRLEVRDCNRVETHMCDEESLEMVFTSEVWDKICHIPTIIFNEIDVRTGDHVEDMVWS
ncbi:Putative disease resistance protein RGA1 [Linum perenne]